jgi:hypothetical protein
MLIDPKVKSLIIFNGGGGIVQREMKLSLNQGSNEFQIQNVPASFDPNSADIRLEYVNPEDKEIIYLQQTIVSLPERNNAQQIIDREKSAATSIISYAIDFTREMRQTVSNICEASSYRTYADMVGTFNFIINTKKDSEIIVKILYFVNDIRIKWETNLQVNINEDGKSAEIEGFIVVNNQTGFSYENVELGFAIFELPSDAIGGDAYEPPYDQQAYYEGEEQAEIAMPQQQIRKRTQRLKNLML